MRKLDKIIKERRKYPKIICDDMELLSDIGCWIGVKSRVKEEFGKVLLNLGFNTTDEIVLCKYDKKTFSFTYIVNGRNPYKKNIISLDCGFIDREPKITISTGTRKTRELSVYKCSRCKHNRIDDKFTLVCEDRKLSNGVSYRRIYSFLDAKIIVEYPGNYSLIINITKPYNNTCINKNYRLVNENKIVDYLVNLKMPISIEDFYKEMCNICLEFSNILTRVSGYIRNFNNSELDKIEIQYGELVEMLTIRDGEYYKYIDDNLNGKGVVRVLDDKGRNNYVWSK